MRHRRLISPLCVPSGVVNHPPTMRSHGKDAARAMRRKLMQDDTRVLMLTLTLVETCVKNCGRRFHELVVQKEVLSELARLGQKARADVEVRDKALSLIQEWAEALRLNPYVETRNQLRAKGVVFPGRNFEAFVPIHTPPQSVPQELDPEDAVAIAAAIAQTEEELQTAGERRAEEETRRRVAEHMGSGVDFMNARKMEKRHVTKQPSNYMAVPQQDQYQAPSLIYGNSDGAKYASQAATTPTDYWQGSAASASAGPLWQQQPRSAAAASGAPVLARPALFQGSEQSPPARQHSVAPAADAQDVLVAAATSAEVLREMLAAEAHGEVLADLAAQCRTMMSTVHSLVATASDEALLVQGLGVNDELQHVLAQYDARASAGQQGQPPPLLPPRPAGPPSEPRAAPAATGGPVGLNWGDEEEESKLAVNRGRGRSTVGPSPATPLLAAAAVTAPLLPPPPSVQPRVPQPAPVVAAPAVAQPSIDSLLDMLAAPSPAPAVTPPPPVPVFSPIPVPTADFLASDLDARLQLPQQGPADPFAMLAQIHPPPSASSSSGPQGSQSGSTTNPFA